MYEHEEKNDEGRSGEEDGVQGLEIVLVDSSKHGLVGLLRAN